MITSGIVTMWCREKTATSYVKPIIASWLSLTSNKDYKWVMITGCLKPQTDWFWL